MTFDVQFSLEAAAELLRITEVIGSTVVVLKAAESIRHQLEDDPADKGAFLSEGLYYIDHAPLHSTMFGMVYTLNQLVNFGLAEHSWQFLATLAEGDHGDDPGSWQRDGVEET